MRRRIWIVVAIALPLAAAIPQPVRIELGAVSGVPSASGAVVAFKGLPFAAPPTGENRWRAPQPAAPWQGVRKADRFSASCTSYGPETGSA
jgi:para-nitrobenzyl esterase